ncbi:Ig family protein, partial [Calderihabitans maritimus]
LMLLITP